MNRLSDVLVVDVGAGTTDLCPVFGTFPADEDQVTLPVGGDWIDQDFHQRIADLCPDAQVSRNMAREIKEKFGFVHDVDERVTVTLPVAGKPKRFDLTEPLKAACRRIVPPIVAALRELVAGLDPEYRERLLRNVLLGGGGSQLKGLDLVLEEELQEFGPAKVKRAFDPVFAGAVGALKLAMGMPPDSWDCVREVRAEAAAA
jgi:rod shape-determining protein MreB